MEVVYSTKSTTLPFPFLPPIHHHHHHHHLNHSSHFLDFNRHRKVTVLRLTSSANDENWKDGEGFTTLKHDPSVDTDKHDSIQAEQIESEESSSPFQDFVDASSVFKLDSEGSYAVFLYGGGGALVAVWLLSAVVGAIDSIPVFPKLLEVVGLGYSLWFMTRYLLFKKNRDELGAKIEELKEQVIGPGDN